MKIKEGFVLKEIAGQYVVIALGAASRVFNGIIKLNETGKTLWEALSSDTDEQRLVDALLAEYDVDEQTAKKDVKKFVEQLQGANILE